MPTKNEVFLIADRMLADGEEPTLRTVTRRLANGGSPRDVCPLLRSWRSTRGHNPRLDVKDLSAELRASLNAFGKAAYRIAQKDAAKRWVQDRAENDAIRQAEAKDLEYLLGLIDVAEGGKASLLARAEAAEAEAARVTERLTKVENQLDRFRAEEFWDRVMREIHEILPVSGTMTPDEILPELRQVTIRGAALHKEPLTPATLRKKMDVRITHGKYFERDGDGRYGRKTG